MPTATWVLALVVLIYYVPSLIPISYCTWEHDQTGLSGWLFILTFTVLQIISSALTLGAGRHGPPPITATIITNTGPAWLLLGIAGLVYEWTNIVRFLDDRWLRRFAQIILILYHLAVLGATAIYIAGASMASQRYSSSTADTVQRAGILLLLLFWVHLSAIFALLTGKLGARSSTPHFWSLGTCLVLLGARIIYEVVVTFKSGQQMQDSMVNTVVFEFLPGALIVLDAVVGGVTSVQPECRIIEDDTTMDKCGFDELSDSEDTASKRQLSTVDEKSCSS